MKSTAIGIIGGNGAMGQWFAAFFRNNGHTVHIADIGSGPTIPELAERCSVIIVSVPIGATLEVIAGIGPHLKSDQLLMDLTSLKADPVKAMLQFSSSEVIGLHPLFGPDTAGLKGQNMVICPGRGHQWLPWLKEILERNGARMTITTPEKHDEIMSIIQGLNHVNTIMMGLALRDANLSADELDRYSTPAFRSKMDMVEKVFDQNPGLYAEIIALNPCIDNILGIYERRLSLLKNLIAHKDTQGLAALLKTDYSVKNGPEKN